MAMLARWFKDCKNPEEKEQLDKTLRNSHYLFDKMREIIEEYKSEVKEDRIADYDKPSWPYYQADCNGANRAFDRVLRLIDIERT